ncbi:hypothetical protein [Caballeronia sp. GaOx3]|uniref:hypothetical protein n=1 Tax=Caballeronia sp. GaOx3 TaxID=2921740 RepID=UPI0020278157|nr:hypothetical protein [Caballeronia sp. GaOx3]
MDIFVRLIRHWTVGKICCQARLAICATALLTACSSFQETHFFRSDTQQGSPPNYFRLVVSGHTGLSSARYISGYFDEEIVNQYFNEIGQPDKGKLIPLGSVPSGPGPASDANTAGKPKDNKGADAQNVNDPTLVMLLSTNSDEIAAQLGALTQSQQFTTALTSLFARSRFSNAGAAGRQLQESQAQGQALAQLGDSLIGGLSDKPTLEETKANMLAYVNQLSAAFNAAPFDSLEKANEWYSKTRSKLMQGSTK